ncbi:MFS transporter [Paenibacillus piri]|uniref:MFS transporter n=1 Tax=Paenibacillus piri TaxID=2547395 RepID=A0A4R5KT14_9BACL|nr:MFS transporter [Paenibacillus piri]TDF98572.1 MFS transporter [Paenibacillus piri]
MRPASAVRAVGIYGGGVFFAVNSVAQPFFTLYAESLGASTAVIGFLVTLRALLPMIIAMPVGQMIDTLGPLRLTKLGCLLMIVSLALTASSTLLPLLAVSQLLLGASTIMVASSLQVLAADGESDKALRNRNINRYSTWSSAGSMAGPLLGGLVVSFYGASLSGYRAAFIASLAVCIVSFAAVWRVAAVSPGEPMVKGETRRLFRPRAIMDSYMSGIHLTKYRGIRFGLAGTFLIMFIQSLYGSFIPLYLNGAGYSTLIISVIVSLTGMAGLLSRLFLALLMKRMTMERILISAGCLAAICLILIPLGSLHVAGMIALTILLGSSVGINLPVSIMIMVDETKDAERGKVMGLRLLTNRLSQMSSPALFGVLGQTMGLTAAFCAGGTLLLATMLGFAVYSSARLNRPAQGEEPAVAPAVAPAAATAAEQTPPVGEAKPARLTYRS